VKCAALDSDGDRIKGLWESPIMPDRSSLRDRLDADRMRSRLTDLFGELFRRHSNWPHRACTAIQGEGTFCRYLELPPMSDKELAVAVPAMASQVLPFAVEDLVLEYMPVPPIKAGEKKRGVLLVAALRSKVERLRAMLQAAGIEIAHLETTALAMVRSFVRNHRVPDDECMVLVHAGSSWTHLIGLCGPYPYFIREFTPAAGDFVYACQMGAQTSWEDAEILLNETDVMEPDTLCEPAVGRWLSEVRRSIECFSRQAGRQPSTIILSGGGGTLRGLEQRLVAETSLVVRRDHWERLREAQGADRKPTAMLYNTAVGLALAA